MTTDDIVALVEDIKALVLERRYELALALTTKLEEQMAEVPLDDPAIPPAVRDLVKASRQLTESLITLRGLQVH